MRKFVFCVLFFGIVFIVKAQDNTVVPDGFNKFLHANGNVASEGMMRDGKPDGYWKTYWENGTLKAEGNRKNFELDSLWNFYDENGNITLQINYLNGKKEGIRRTIRENEIVEENFSNDVKHGLTVYRFPDGLVMRTINFENGLENGFAREFDSDGTVITMIEYRRGFVVDRENINRKDRNGLKQGKWKFFYPDGKVKTEGVYRDDKRNGYFKEYDEKGMLTDVSKYVNDIRQEEVPELVKLDVRTDYYPDGKVKTRASYKGEIPEGIRREYAQTGEVISAYTYKNGKLIGEGIVDDEGMREGAWKEFYEDGQLRSEGVYRNGNRIGKWRFYHPDGALEQEGNYNNQGNTNGLWKWYYSNGLVLREENFLNGNSEGIFTEFDENGDIIIQGEYVEGLEEGFWKYQHGDHREEGTYRGGMRNGEWKYYYDDGQLSFQGSYIDDNPNGRHIWYWPNGKKKDEGEYLMGMKNNEWIQYNNDGTIFMVISYQNGIERKYDGVRIKPEFTE
ncbi:MAG: toxin-antitoxin system YwqK family antitoxin [Lentimicrobium sp.]|nr:toxin-antitoxin system YwqK family antitoxin [Lentimicrobium sp.]